LDGIRYERKAHQYLAERFPSGHVLAPWVSFKSRERIGYFHCQPDALILDLRRNSITVVEIKLKHTSDAWWQVRQLYMPVVQHIFGPSWDYIAVELAKWFDPHTKFPERFEFVDDVGDLPALSPRTFHVHLWNGRGQ